MAGYKKPPSSTASSRAASPDGKLLSEKEEDRRRGINARRSRETSLEVVEDGRRRLSAGQAWNEGGGELDRRRLGLGQQSLSDRFPIARLIVPEEPSSQVVSFAEDLLSAAAALETQAESSAEDAKETQSLNEDALGVEAALQKLRIDSTGESSSTSNADPLRPVAIAQDSSAEYSWEWGGFPMKSPAITDKKFDFSTLPRSASDSLHATRASSLPPTGPSVDSDPSAAHASSSPTTPPHTQPPPPLRLASYPPGSGRHDKPDSLTDIPVEGRLKNHEEDPYKFTFEVDTPGDDQKRSHSFELSLCGNEGLGVDSKNVSSLLTSIHQGLRD